MNSKMFAMNRRVDTKGWTPRLSIRRFATGWAVLGSLMACSSDSSGLDSSQLESQLVSSSSSAWADLATPYSTESDVPSPDVVRQAFEELAARRAQCGRDPSSCDVSRLAVPGSNIERRLGELMAARVADGIVASERGRAVHRVEAVEFDAPDRAMVTTCLHDDTVLVIDEAIYDDSVYSARSVWTLVETNGEWLWSDERILEWVMEDDLCDEL